MPALPLGSELAHAFDKLVNVVLMSCEIGREITALGQAQTGAAREKIDKIISKLASQGAANFRRGGEDVDTGKVDQATYDKMSYGEKKAYAERMSGKAA